MPDNLNNDQTQDDINAMSNLSDDVLLDVCFRLISIKQHWLPFSEWQGQHYATLATSVFEITRTNISYKTIERICRKLINGNDTYNPQLQTKNALAIYLDYKNWDDFKIRCQIISAKKPGVALKNILYAFSNTPNTQYQDHQIKIQPSSENGGEKLVQDLDKTSYRYANSQGNQISDEDLKENISITKRPLYHWGIAVLITLIMAAFAIYIFRYITNTRPVFKLEATMTDGNLPHTSTFKYKLISGKMPDTAFINFGNFERKLLTTDSGTINHCYFLPGYFRCYLSGIKTQDTLSEMYGVSIFSKGWMCLPRFKTRFEKIASSKFLMKDGSLKVTPVDIQQAEFDTIKGKNALEFRYFEKLKASNLDNSELVAYITNLSTKGISDGGCVENKIILVGETGSVEFSINSKGCSRYNVLKYAEKSFTGEVTDLRQFELNTLTENKITTRISNKTLMVYFNDILIYKDTYVRNMGALKGLTYFFSQAGMVRYYKLTDLTNRRIILTGGKQS